MGSAASCDVMSGGVKTITLISADNERFEVPEAAASLSQVIRNAINNNSSAAAVATGGGIQLSKIPGKVLAKVLEYCSKHAAAAAGGGSSGDAASSGEAGNDNEEELVRRFDEEFIDGVDKFMLYDLELGAFYLEIEGLEDLACHKVRDRLEKRAVEIRKTFRIKDNYFAPPDKEDDDDKKQWLFV
ncbi:unnamed protein product [Urochloa decumbens]|uniref:SKP1-like protein n=1 Tax=Urochloa decumbens TaxID=240449 RepID=A0ABC9DN03_9POAL